MRSFIYLDEYKMYSLSSQIMEGVTDFVIKESRQVDSETTDQKGPYTSGKKMAEIIETASASVEKKFLHDYAFSIFEDKLVELGKLIAVTSETKFEELALDAQGRRLVRVKAKVRFMDSTDLQASISKLVDLQESLSIVGNNERREELIGELDAISANVSKKGAAAGLRSELATLSKSVHTREEIENSRLHYKHLAALIQQGFKGRLDVRMEIKDCNIRADLKRSCLKDPEEFIFKTYSRLESSELVLLGIVTQYVSSGSESSSSEESVEPDDEPDSGLADIMMRSTEALHELDKLFNRVKGNQIVIDPIALYLEL